MDKIHELKRKTEWVKQCPVEAAETIIDQQNKLEHANATIRDMEEEYRQLHEQYTIMNMAYEATMKAIRG